MSAEDMFGGNDTKKLEEVLEDSFDLADYVDYTYQKYKTGSILRDFLICPESQ